MSLLLPTSPWKPCVSKLIFNDSPDADTPTALMRTFVDKFFYHPGTTPQEPFGLYIQAFCTGLDQVLDSYRKTLIDLEKQVLTLIL